MKRSLVFFAIFFLSLVLGPSSWAGCPGDVSLSENPGRIHHLKRTAHTEEQFTALANYYEVKRQVYARKALEQRHLWADRAEVISPVMEKWPRPVDSSRNLYEYYAQEATKAAALSAKYTQMGDAVASQPEPR